MFVVCLSQILHTDTYNFNGFDFFLHYINPEINTTELSQNLEFTDDDYHELAIFRVEHNLANIQMEIHINQVNQFPCNSVLISLIHSSSQTVYLSNVVVNFIFTIQNFKQSAISIIQGSQNQIINNVTISINANLNKQNFVVGMVSNSTGFMNISNSLINITLKKNQGLILGGLTAIGVNSTLFSTNLTVNINITANSYQKRWKLNIPLTRKQTIGGIAAVCDTCLIYCKNCIVSINLDENKVGVGSLVGAGKQLEFDVVNSQLSHFDEISMFLNKLVIEGNFHCNLQGFGLYGEGIYECDS